MSTDEDITFSNLLSSILDGIEQGALILILLCIVSIIFAPILGVFMTGENVFAGAVPAEGGEVGPFEIKNTGWPARITFEQPLSVSKSDKFQKKNTSTKKWYGAWSWIEFDVLDDQKNGLFGAGGEVSDYRGKSYDDGSWWDWRERDLKFRRYFIPRHQGDYHLKVRTKKSDDHIKNPIKITIRSGGMISYFPFWLGIMYSFFLYIFLKIVRSIF